MITERCGWTSASCGRELAAPDELGDERVVVGQLLEPVVAQQVGARVADVADRDRPVVLDQRDRHRRAHPGGCRVGRGALVDAAVRLLDQLDDVRLAARGAALDSSSAPAASAEATSPACAPPIPSATAKSGGAAT